MKSSANPEPGAAPSRLFFALWPNGATRAALAALQSQLKGRKTPPDRLHLTLAFLGPQPLALLPALRQVLAGMPAPDILLHIDCLGYFARRRIAWAGAHQVPEQLPALQFMLAQALRQQDIEFDQRLHFKPHITLARDAEPPAALPFAPIPWRIDCLALVQSLTPAEGGGYRVLATRAA